MTKEEAATRYAALAGKRAAIYAEGRSGSEHAWALIPEDRLVTVVLALRAFYSSYHFGVQCTADKDALERYLYDSCDDSQQHALDQLAEIEDNYYKEWRNASE